MSDERFGNSIQDRYYRRHVPAKGSRRMVSDHKGRWTEDAELTSGEPMSIKEYDEGTSHAHAADKIADRKDVDKADEKRAEKDYDTEKFADPVNKKYPIDDEEHIRAAWEYIHHPNDADEYSSKDLATIKRRIVSAWKKKINKDGPPEAETNDSFESLVSKLEKEGKSKEYATKIAGKVAAEQKGTYHG